MLPPRVPLVRPDASPAISEGYRQALEPYTDPEQLELSDHKPPLPPPAIAPVTVLTEKYHPYEAVLTWFVMAACLLGLTYPAWYSQVVPTTAKGSTAVELPAH